MINIEEYPYVRYDYEKILEDTNPYSYFKALQERKKFLSAIRQKTTITVNEDYSIYKHIMRRIFDRAEVRGTSYSSKIAPCMRIACEPKHGDFPHLFCDEMIQLDRVIFNIRIIDIDFSEYTYKQSGYQHMPLDLKIKYLELIKGFKEVTVCEDVSEHYLYWEKNVNENPDDCCNLRKII